MNGPYKNPYMSDSGTYYKVMSILDMMDDARQPKTPYKREAVLQDIRADTYRVTDTHSYTQNTPQELLHNLPTYTMKRGGETITDLLNTQENKETYQHTLPPQEPRQGYAAEQMKY